MSKIMVYNPYETFTFTTSNFIENCVEPTNVKDTMGKTCSSYFAQTVYDCGKYDHDGFKAHELCCACRFIGNVIY